MTHGAALITQKKMHLSSLAVASLLSLVTAADPPTCGAGQAACPEEYPCCSIEGTCGNGYVCLGGCDPRFSNTPGSCMPMPICQNKNYKFSSSDLLTNYTSYRGDAGSDPFIYVGDVTESNGKIRAAISEANPAAIITLNNYVWYGKVSLTMKASHGAGVISDLILISDAKDEIDFELVGSDTVQAQTNYYWQGVLNYKNMIGAQTEDFSQNTITYTIDWQQDKIDWIINGNTVRTLNREDTKNATTGAYAFPQTPQRVQFGLWAAGDSPYQGTSEWAGGSVDWSAAGSDGYYVEVSELDVQCYDAPSGTSKTGDKSYVYTDKAALSSDIAISGNDTILVSLDGTGENPCGSQCKDSDNSTESTDGGATLGGSVASSSDDATLSGSVSESSTESSESTETGSASGSGSASTSGAGSRSGSGSGSASGSTASATGSTARATASGSASASGSETQSNAAAAVGAAAILAPLAFLL